MPQWALTLLAVFVGGLLSYLTQRALEKGRAARESQRDKDQAATELRVAIRLVLDDLDVIALHYKMLADDGRYPEQHVEPDRPLYFPTAAWDANKRTLAAELSEEQWSGLSDAMHAADGARLLVLRGVSLAPIQPPIRRVLHDGAQNARQLYISLAGKPPPSAE